MAPAASLAAARSLTAALSSSATARPSSDKVGSAGGRFFNFVEISFFMQALCFCARWWVFGLSSTLFSLFFGDVCLEYSLKGFFALVLTYRA
jgi:hypothetical protein